MCAAGTSPLSAGKRTAGTRTRAAVLLHPQPVHRAPRRRAGSVVLDRRHQFVCPLGGRGQSKQVGVELGPRSRCGPRLGAVAADRSPAAVVRPGAPGRAPDRVCGHAAAPAAPWPRPVRAVCARSSASRSKCLPAVAAHRVLRAGYIGRPRSRSAASALENCRRFAVAATSGSGRGGGCGDCSRPTVPSATASTAKPAASCDGDSFIKLAIRYLPLLSKFLKGSVSRHIGTGGRARRMPRSTLSARRRSKLSRRRTRRTPRCSM